MLRQSLEHHSWQVWPGRQCMDPPFTCLGYIMSSSGEIGSRERAVGSLIRQMRHSPPFPQA